MAAQSKQVDMLAVAARIASICGQAQSSKAYTQNEQRLLSEREGEILDAASVISMLVSGEIENKTDQEAIFNAVITLSMGAFDVGMITHTSDASKKFHIGNNASSGRHGLAKKLEPRDEVLRRELGPLIEKGLKGEKLREALIDVFAREGIVDRLRAKPGLRTVQGWAEEYRKQGKWRPIAQS